MEVTLWFWERFKLSLLRKPFNLWPWTQSQVGRSMVAARRLLHVSGGSNQARAVRGRSSMVPRYLLSFCFKNSLFSSASLEVLLLEVFLFVEKLRLLIILLGLCLLPCPEVILLVCAHPLIYSGRTMLSSQEPIQFSCAQESKFSSGLEEQAVASVSLCIDKLKLYFIRRIYFSPLLAMAPIQQLHLIPLCTLQPTPRLRLYYTLITAMDCFYHPKNPLLNFCLNPQCALPLCPKCISIHLSQSAASHEIVALNEAMASISQQLETICGGLGKELKLLRQEYEPERVIRDYKEMIQKYRAEAINEVNRHYDYLERELLAEIGTIYSQNLQSLLVPLQDQLASLQKAKKSITLQDRALQTLILIVSQQTITAAEHLLLKIKDKKTIFKSQLPRLQDGEGGKLKMAAERIDVVSQRYPVYPAAPVLEGYPAASGLERIAQLQARLHTLRYEC